MIEGGSQNNKEVRTRQKKAVRGNRALYGIDVCYFGGRVLRVDKI